MAQANRAERKANADRTRSRISTVISGLVYEQRQEKAPVDGITKRIDKFIRMRAKQDPGSAHLYYTVSKKIIAEIS